MLLAAGNQNARDLLRGNPAGLPITQIAVGTSDTPVTYNDTTITGQVIKAVTTTNLLPNGLVQFTAQLAAGDPPMTINEIGLMDVNGRLLHRKVQGPFTKVAGVTYTINFTVKALPSS